MAKKETLTDDGKLEEVDMEEAKDDNKKLGMPAVDGEEGRDEKENDEIEGGTKKTDGGLKTKKSNASAKQERTVGLQMMSVQGPHAREIEDLRIALRAMSSSGELDPWWTPINFEMPKLKKPIKIAINK